jgi:hypothetical protein
MRILLGGYWCPKAEHEDDSRFDIISIDMQYLTQRESHINEPKGLGEIRYIQNQ